MARPRLVTRWRASELTLPECLWPCRARPVAGLAAPNQGNRVNGNQAPPDEAPVGPSAMTGDGPLRKNLGVWIALGLVCFALGVFGLLALRRANGASRALGCTSSAEPTFIDEVVRSAVPPEEAAALDGGDLASSTDEARTRVLAWKPPVASGTPPFGDQKAALPVKVDDHSLGPHNAEVTLMLFGDLYCPFTLRMLKMLRTWLDEQPTAFRLVWRERPLDVHPGSADAALVAERLALRYGEPAFWRFVAALSELDRTASAADLTALEAGFEVGKPRVSEFVGGSRAAAKLERDRLLALTYAIYETPTLFVNGFRFKGEMSRTHLEQLVSEEQQAVEELLDDSIPSSDVYSIRVDANLLDWIH